MCQRRLFYVQALPEMRRAVKRTGGIEAAHPDVQMLWACTIVGGLYHIRAERLFNAVWRSRMTAAEMMALQEDEAAVRALVATTPAARTTPGRPLPTNSVPGE